MKNLTNKEIVYIKAYIKYLDCSSWFVHRVVIMFIMFFFQVIKYKQTNTRSKKEIMPKWKEKRKKEK